MVYSPKNNKLSLETFRAALGYLPATRHYWVAYSGGVDSHTLLHLIVMLRQQQADIRITAIHIHHGLQAEADAWAEHCQTICSEIDVPLQIIHVNAHAKSGQSPEEVARISRYQAFKSLVKKNDILLTAQHQDDQAETVLLQLLRGSGLAGLAAMPIISPFGSAYLARPLLAFSQQALYDYATQYQLFWIEDLSNLDTHYDRNYLRQSILPLLRQRWPGFNKTLHRTSQHCADSQALLTELADELLVSAHNPVDNTVAISILAELTPSKQRLLLRAWIQQSGLRYPSTHTIERIITEVLPAKKDKVPIVNWSEGCIRRYRNTLYLSKPEPYFDCATKFNWDGEKPLLMSGNGSLAAVPTLNKGICAQQWKHQSITICFRTGGERGRIAHRTGQHSLKKLFQECSIPPWIRNRIPLVYLGDQLAAVPGLWIFESFLGQPGKPAIHLEWFREHPLILAAQG